MTLSIDNDYLLSNCLVNSILSTTLREFHSQDSIYRNLYKCCTNNLTLVCIFITRFSATRKPHTKNIMFAVYEIANDDNKSELNKKKSFFFWYPFVLPCHEKDDGDYVKYIDMI